MVAAAGAAAIAIANAIKASGVVIQTSAEDFMKILGKVENPLVIHSKGGFFSTKYNYLVSHKGFAFYTKSSTPLLLPSGIEMIVAEKIWTPQ